MSFLSQVEEQLPVEISIISATGTDVQLAQLVADMMASNDDGISKEKEMGDQKVMV